ncbi:MAG: hypothetical protein K2X37_01920, partial [Chitinophagaceae bacterium]|nr:hypothetical protein [Chitinophagaceae bacterium]
SLKKKSIASISTAIWDAGLILSGDPANNIVAAPLPASRNIYTAKVAADGSLATVPFVWSNGSNFSASDQIALNTNPNTNTVDNLASDRIDYLRGVRTKEITLDANGNSIGTFRPRDGALGDIINSAPIYYGAPAKNIIGTGYSTFYTNNLTRQAAVYVGANDGMLHAFNANTGIELFSYIPNALISKLPKLADPYYSHTAFVDGKITINETQVKNSWKTVLVSGMGAGNKGIFALDVTNPANFTSGLGAIWEFTDKNDADMGQVLVAPTIAKFRTGKIGTTITYGNFVVVSSGYNNYDSNPAATGKGALFLLSLDKDPSAAWVLGSNYFKILTPISDVTKKNALGPPSVAYGSDGAANYVYAGDLQGNMWRFVFSNTNTSLTTAQNQTIKSVFTAKTTAGNVQPITVKPRITIAPGGGYVLFFGTGKYVESVDTIAGNYDTSSYYAILDTTYNVDIVTGRSQLESRTATASGTGFTLSGNSFVYGTTSGTKKGWYFDFYNSSTTGERSVSD